MHRFNINLVKMFFKHALAAGIRYPIIFNMSIPALIIAEFLHLLFVDTIFQIYY